MELIKVNSVKLKIILTSSDMTELGITENELDYNSAASRKIFWDILDKAKAQTGFDAAGTKLYVQFYPSKDGGGEIYVTRKARLLPDTQKGSYRKKYYTGRNYGLSGYIVCTESTESLIRLCMRLKKQKYACESSLYYHSGSYYLCLLEKKTKPSFCQSVTDEPDGFEPVFISEYGKVFAYEKVRAAFLTEHAKKLCEADVIEIFCEKFG